MQDKSEEHQQRSQLFSELIPASVAVPEFLAEEQDLELRQEKTRSKLATYLVWILTGTLSASFFIRQKILRIRSHSFDHF